MAVTIRDAVLEDAPDVIEFTSDTWPDREATDYLPRVFEEWVEGDDAAGRTLVADTDGRAVGVLRVDLLSEYEAWLQGMRVDPAYRDRGIATRLTHAAFAWARDRGATVARNLVFAWNRQGLGLSRSVGFEPVTAFRWAHPDPDAADEPSHDVTAEPAAAWRWWSRSDARSALGGLALDRGESWAVSELTRRDLEYAAENAWLGVVQRDGTAGFAHRVRGPTGTDDGERWAEYGVAAWDDLEAARSVFDAIGRDARSLDVDAVRVVVPATVRVASDVAAAGVAYGEESDFVLDADLTRTY